MLSTFGVHLAADALLRELAEMEKTGDVKFLDAEARKKVVAYLTTYGGDGVVTGEKARATLAEVSAKLG